ncbi:hypothetical protein [Streptomyces sp. NPDC088350]|uniref:hypothetical protein n=1 Tax=Streptomyces sp. NPDC088350 TaxID=3365854 RepID=UPI00382441E4
MTALDTADRILAAGLRQTVHELQATTGTAMVPLDDGQTLANVLVAGDPLSIFTVADHHAMTDDRYIGAVAYRTGRQCVRVLSETPSGVRPAIPFPYATVATPLIGSDGRSFGVVVHLWAGPFADQGLDVVVDFAGYGTTTAGAVETVRRDGRVVQVGLGVTEGTITSRRSPSTRSSCSAHRPALPRTA